MYAVNRLRSALLCALVLAGIGALAAAQNEPPAPKYTCVERLALERLRAAHEDVERLAKLREPAPVVTDLKDYRAIMHVHAEDSDHTGGTLEEALRDAKTAGVDVIMLSDHLRPPRDFIDGRWRGLKDGVLFIPGSEAKGYLVYPEQSILDKMDAPRDELIAAVTAGDGLIFLSHVEGKLDWPMDGLTGMEIYNRHADAMDELEGFQAIFMAMADPAGYAALQEGLRRYPDAFLAFQHSYMQDYIGKWDKESQKQRVAGIAANDCHHNQIYVTKVVDENTVLVGNLIEDKDEDMTRLTAEQRPGIPEMTRGHQPGDIVARIDIDPYHVFFHNVSTHILAEELTEEAIRDALKEGRAYVSHDWMGDPAGFIFIAAAANGSGGPMWMMGSEAPFEQDLTLSAHFTLPCKIRLIRNGALVHESEGRELSYDVGQQGVYRVEGWLQVDGEWRPWIYSNPIYVRARETVAAVGEG